MQYRKGKMGKDTGLKIVGEFGEVKRQVEKGQVGMIQPALFKH